MWVAAGGGGVAHEDFDSASFVPPLRFVRRVTTLVHTCLCVHLSLFTCVCVLHCLHACVYLTSFPARVHVRV